MSRKTIPAQFLPADTDVTDIFEVMQEDESGKKTTAQIHFDDLVSDLNDTSDDAELRIYRQTVLGGKSSMPFLDSFPVDKFTYTQMVKYLKDQYGGGEYRIHVRANGKLVVNKLLTIETPKQIDTRMTPTGEAANILGTVLDRMERQNALIMELLKNGNQQPSRREMLDEMLIFKQLFSDGHQGGGGNALSQLKDTLSVLGELGIEIGGQKEEKEAGFGDMLEKMAPLITAAVAAPKQPEKRRDPMFAQKLMIKTGISQLMKAASKNSAPEVYAEMILDQLPENVVQEFITNPGAFEKLIKIEPRAAQFRPWFELVGEHVKAQLGAPSTVSDLYDEQDDAINGETDTPDDMTDAGTD